jgi:hypothetical protein
VGKYIYVSLRVVTSLLIIVCAYLFYMQSTNKEIFISDCPPHISFIINPALSEAAGYSLLHKIISICHLFFPSPNIEKAVTFCMISLESLAVIYSIYLMFNFFKQTYNNSKMALLFALVLSMVSMLIMQPNAYSLYLGNWSPNPWHNPTFIFAKPFCILAFMLASKLVSGIVEPAKTFTLFAIVMAISVWAKPSFYLSFAPAIAIYTSIRFINKKIVLYDAIRMALCLLPAAIIIFWMNLSIYNSTNSTNQVVIAAGKVWHLFSKNIFLSIILGGAFPIITFIISYKKWQPMFILAFLNYIIALLLFYFVAENGDRLSHANFSWTYMFALFFMFFASVNQLYFQSEIKNKMYYVATAIFIAHIVSGIFYFGKIVSGNLYF